MMLAQGNAVRFWDPVGYASVPGLLLIFEIAVIYWWQSVLWAQEPIDRAGLSRFGLSELRSLRTEAKLRAKLFGWSERLSIGPNTGDHEIAKASLNGVLRHALYRDVAYHLETFLFLWFALYFARTALEQASCGACTWMADALQGAGAWSIAGAFLATGLLVDAFNLLYCRVLDGKHRLGWRVIAGFAASLSNYAIGIAVAIVVAGGVGEALIYSAEHLDDWRSKAAVLVFAGGVAAGLSVAIAIVHERVVQRRKRRSRARTASPGTR